MVELMEIVNVQVHAAWILEPPVIHAGPYTFIENNYSKFDLVFTHKQVRHRCRS